MRRKKRKNLRSKKEENIIKMKKPLDLSNTGREEKWYFFFSFIPFDASGFIKIKKEEIDDNILIVF